MRANRPSATARLIAAATVLSSLRPSESHLVPHDAAKWSEELVRAAGGRLLLATLRNRTGRRLWGLVERLTIPGILRHYQLRKRWIERVWEQARSDGFRQLIVLGAGLDTLALRAAAADPRVRCIEVDHPATQEVKRRVLAQPGVMPPVSLLPADLSVRSVADVLDQAETSAQRLDHSARTSVIAEGLLMYFPADRVRRILTELSRLPVAGTRLAMTYMERVPGRPIGFRPHSRLVDVWLRMRGEPFRWAATEAEVTSLLGECGWQAMELVRSAEIARSLGLTSGMELSGENIVLAEVAHPG